MVVAGPPFFGWGGGGGGGGMSEAVCNCPGLTSGGQTGQAQAF